MLLKSGVVVVVVLAIAGCHEDAAAPAVTQDQLSQITAIFAATDASLATADAAFHDAVAKLDTVTPGTAPCTVPFALADDSRSMEQLAFQLQNANIAHSSVRAGTVTVTPDRSELAKLTSASVSSRRDEQQRLLAREDDYAALAGPALIARAHQLATQPLATELLIVVTAGTDPTQLDHDHFTAGSAEARAYLYSAAEHRFACAGEMAATSSNAVNAFVDRAGSDSNTSLTADLYLNVIAAAQQSLRTVR